MTTTTAGPLDLSRTGWASARVPDEQAEAFLRGVVECFRFSIQVDGVEVAGDVRRVTLSKEDNIFLDPPPTFCTLSLTLGPGLHPMLVTAQADGFLTLSPVPEPTTLLLVGTTAASLGLARWRQRRHKQRQVTGGGLTRRARRQVVPKARSIRRRLALHAAHRASSTALGRKRAGDLGRPHA
jgi:hypothetical protein